MITISCQQKKEHVTQLELEAILYHLSECGLTLSDIHYENSGMYKQLHIHCFALCKGKYKQLTQYGDKDFDKTFRIQFTKLRRDTPRFYSYLTKEDSSAALTTNYYSNKYFNQSTQRFELITALRSRIGVR